MSFPTSSDTAVGRRHPAHVKHQPRRQMRALKDQAPLSTRRARTLRISNQPWRPALSRCCAASVRDHTADTRPATRPRRLYPPCSCANPAGRWCLPAEALISGDMQGTRCWRGTCDVRDLVRRQRQSRRPRATDDTIVPRSLMAALVVFGWAVAGLLPST